MKKLPLYIAAYAFRYIFRSDRLLTFFSRYALRWWSDLPRAHRVRHMFGWRETWDPTALKGLAIHEVGHAVFAYETRSFTINGVLFLDQTGFDLAYTGVDDNRRTTPWLIAVMAYAGRAAENLMGFYDGERLHRESGDFKLFNEAVRGYWPDETEEFYDSLEDAALHEAKMVLEPSLSEMRTLADLLEKRRWLSPDDLARILK